MRLLCKSKYTNSPAKLFFAAGVIEVDPKVAEYLLRDAPENFEIVTETKSYDAPPQDKAIKSPRGKK